MASVLTITCDRCNAQITEDRHRIQVASGSLRNRRPEADLCVTCFSRWLEAIDGPRLDNLGVDLDSRKDRPVSQRNDWTKTLPRPYRDWLFCAACGRAISEGGTARHGATGVFLGKTGEHARESVTLCHECLVEFDAWLNAAVLRGYRFAGFNYRAPEQATYPPEAGVAPDPGLSVARP